MSEIYTTLKKIREYEPCKDSWGELLKSLGKHRADDESLPMLHILDTLGAEDTYWAMRSLPEYDAVWRLLACDYAERVLHLYEDTFPDDRRPRECIDVARKYVIGAASKDELAAARVAARAAASDAAWAAARDAARAARAAWAAGDAAWAAWATAGDAAFDAARAAASDAGWAAGDAENNWQCQRLRWVLANCGDGWVTVCLPNQLAQANERADRAREIALQDFLEARGVETPCSECGGFGRRTYSSTSTWGGGIGGQAMTDDVCDHCWGTGDENRKGADLRKMTRKNAALRATLAKVREWVDDIDEMTGLRKRYPAAFGKLDRLLAEAENARKARQEED